MQLHRILRSVTVLFILATAMATGPLLEAQTVNLSNAALLNNLAMPLPAIATARYRLDNTNWDMAIFNEQPGPPSPADFVVLDLGNQTALSGDTFRFSLENRAAQGLIWKLYDNSDVNGPAGGTVAWGTFAPALLSPFVKADLDGELPNQFFNGINFELRAFAPLSEMHLSNVTFSGATVVGSIGNVSAFYDNSLSSYVASIASDTDLSTFDWTLSGQIRGVKSGGGQEQVAFNVQLVAIPEPGTYALMLGVVTLLGAGLRRRLAATEANAA